MTRSAASAPAGEAGQSPSASAMPDQGLPLAPVAAPFSWWNVIGGGFIAVATILMLLGRGLPAVQRIVQDLGVAFVGIVLEALPFVMLGSLLSGLVEVFVSRERLASILPRRPALAIAAAGCLGLVLPVCECAIIPVTRRLLRKGVPLAAAVAYLLAGPIVNPLVAASTFVAYDGAWLVVGLRLGIGYAVAVSIAIIMHRLFPGTAALQGGSIEQAPAKTCGDGCGHDEKHHHPHPHQHPHQHHHPHPHEHAESSCCAAAQPANLPRKLLEVLHHAADDFLYVAQFLVIGAWLAAACQSVRPAVAALAEAPLAGIPVMMLLAIILNLCSEADAFVAFSFRNIASLPAQLGFMVLGPMLDLKLSAMYLTFLRKRAFFTLAALIFVLVWLAMLLLTLVFNGAPA